MIKNIKIQISNIKNNWGWAIGCGSGIVVLFFILRLVNLTILPVFCDEAIYIRWAQIMRFEPTLRFLPLSDGKQPLFMWFMIPFLSFFFDPLVAGRMVSVLAGFGSLIGIFLLTLQLFKNIKISLLTCLFYVISPFTVFFDRMALVDSLLAMFGIWVLYFGILLVRYQRLDLAMISGAILGGALLTKSPAYFFVLLLPITAVFLPFKKNKFLLIQLIKLVGLWLVSYFIAYAIYNILRLGPNFQMIALRNKDYVFPLSHLFTNPLDPFKSHIVEIWQWYGIFLTWPVFFLGLMGIFLLLKKNWKIGILIFSWWFIPLLFQAEFAKVFTARYILFSVPFFLIFIGFFLGFIFEKVKSSFLIFFILLILSFLPLKFDFLILKSPNDAPLPRNERAGYLEEWTAGTGIKEAASFLKERAKEKKVLVGTEGYFGTLPDGLMIYLEKVPNINIIGIGLYPDKVPLPLIEGFKDNEVYLLINDERLSLRPEEHGLKLIASYPKTQRENGTRQSLLLLKLEKVQEK